MRDILDITEDDWEELFLFLQSYPQEINLYFNAFMEHILHLLDCLKWVKEIHLSVINVNYGYIWYCTIIRLFWFMFFILRIVLSPVQSNPVGFPLVMSLGSGFQSKLGSHQTQKLAVVLGDSLPHS